MPKWTNLFQLPGPVATAITEDIYHETRQSQFEEYCKSSGLDPKTVVHFSVSDLIKPPRMRVLVKRHEQDIIKDVAMDVFRILGQAIHNFLRSAALKTKLLGRGYYIAEERMFFHMQVEGKTVVISGEPDLVTPEDEIHDYKVVAVYSYIKGAKEEWEQQTNLYAFLRSASKGLITKALKIVFILRDWNVNETVQEDYPAAGAQMVEVPLWTFDKQKAYLEERIKLHLQADQSDDNALSECTPYEMWEKPESWAVIREGNHRARKVVKVAGQEGNDTAALHAAEFNKKLKKSEKPFAVEHRPGERTRCVRFCDARQFCSQFQEYAGASFRGNKADYEQTEQTT